MSSQPRTWLITGTSSGFGLELARITIKRGDRVIATSRNPEKIPTIDSDRFHTAQLDQNQPLEEVKARIDNILATFGSQIDVVVNNAAYVQKGTVEESTPEETLRQFQANTLGPMNVYRAILPHMREKRSGTLVTIGSMAAWYPMPSCNLYNASKAATRIFRTGLLEPSANVTDSTSRIPDYKEMNATADRNFIAFNGAQLGNPVKGAEVIYDVITSSGCAQGREVPSWLPLGSDASVEIAKSANQVLADIETWKEISALSDFPVGQ
ncbi:3-oxoacyl-acyl-carrier-protein reductase [Arthroderma uncinatum]|uniref:3-oxoacyl-acyl-carrier-protein reductase n=1 Tax=Arthroderma uncinatum TaxID=74035 RepID=UPI00144A7C5E|nr:3-oxoacyl-acyl-carrier-protein reductase [Arthroderma uncinatum]KAF3483842.1 3-oxoacyl-acyl-carrier-protein reductase [Arthroderma uncinatum]